MWQTLLNLIYPQSGRCPLCGGRVPQPGFCDRCLAELTALEPGTAPCPCCGRTTPGGRLCRDCAADRPSFAWARAAGPYHGALRRLIHTFKYTGKTSLAWPLARLVCHALRDVSLAEFDLVLAVPLGPERLRERGFNQAQLLAEALARLLALPADNRALIKTRDTRVQAQLGRRERETNLRGAFVVAERQAVAGRRLLLVDDVYTTGSTAGECARVLLAAGAAGVAVVTVATAAKVGGGLSRGDVDPDN